LSLAQSPVAVGHYQSLARFYLPEEVLRLLPPAGGVSRNFIRGSVGDGLQEVKKLDARH
jgi:hypothetical protein